ncbi:MAG TPA: type II toxin-antitoxin system prevent-host-death family antitoxin [Terriglobales bacterium]|jgi:prevent-host-death family protein|nr:type II toxin-antitoxin system prevent-host-death family antitoxin [Terriglobales bacterium]
MASVGIRGLKQQLSAYLQRAERGEAVQVTNRGRVIAEIVPPGWRANSGLSPEALAMVAAGTLRLATRPLDRAALHPVTRVPTGTVKRLLDDLRGER